MTNINIELANSPITWAFNPQEDAGLPTAAQMGIFTNKQLDNFGATMFDPCNWFIFDPGISNNNPAWATKNNQSTIDLINPGAILNGYYSYGTNSTLYNSNGPRNLGYTEISDDTWFKVNDYIGKVGIYGNFSDPRTEIWKQGSIEMTIKPTKSNCTLVSGTNFPVNNGPYAVRTQPAGYQTYFAEIKNGLGDEVLVEMPLRNGAQEVGAYYNGWKLVDAFVFPDVEKGVSLSDDTESYRTFGVDLVNGVIRVRYEYHYGNKKYIEFFGTTNLLDGNWHHVVINRPGPYTQKTAEIEYGNEGCMEIWVDGKLEARSFEITATDALPAPKILFNDSTNPGILNWNVGADFYTSLPAGASANQPQQEWKNVAAKLSNYVGGIRDYIYRQVSPLSPHEVNNNYAYAMLNTINSRLLKSPAKKATATMPNPVVTSNKKKVLKLYWNNLLKNKEKFIDGLELDENFDVYSYSITNKNIISPSNVFNLDITEKSEIPYFYSNVKTAIGRHVFVGSPGIVVPQPSSQTQLDVMNEKRIAEQSFGKKFSVNNIAYGGVELVDGDRVLLFNQPKTTNNGVWIYHTADTRMTRPEESYDGKLQNAYVYVELGKYKNKTFIQLNKIVDLKTDGQKWIEVDNEVVINSPQSYPIHTSFYNNSVGEQGFINVNTDIAESYDIICFMNYPAENKDLLDSLPNLDSISFYKAYKEFIDNLKTAVNNGKSIFISSPKLAIDFGVTSQVDYVPQLLETSDAQSAAISPFESGESASNYYDTHRNMKYKVSSLLNNLTNKETYIMSDFVAYSPNKTDSDYHIKYNYRQFGLLEGDEFYIPGLTLLPETLNPELPGYIFNQKNVKDLPVIYLNKLIMGNVITKLSTNIYSGSSLIVNPYNDCATTVAGNYGTGKFFVNFVENGYAFSRLDYNKGRKQEVSIGQNSETALTAAWQYSTKRLNKKNFYDFSGESSALGQTSPTSGGGGAIIQAQSHCSNGYIRKNTNKDDLQFESDLYPDFTEEVFETTEIPVLSMTWLGLNWL